tara:strand:- start:696 stop:959 length:264 start_codon:yes stop_codon:yes gene_type:complete
MYIMTDTKKTPVEDDEVSIVSNSDGDELDIDPEDMMDDGMDLGALLTTEDGDTIPTVLSDVGQSVGEVARQISITNKLLVKLIGKLG